MKHIDSLTVCAGRSANLASDNDFNRLALRVTLTIRNQVRSQVLISTAIPFIVKDGIITLPILRRHETHPPINQ